MHKMLYSNHITTVTFLILSEFSFVEMVIGLNLQSES